jgi:hypothetical protein
MANLNVFIDTYTTDRLAFKAHKVKFNLWLEKISATGAITFPFLVIIEDGGVLTTAESIETDIMTIIDSAIDKPYHLIVMPEIILNRSNLDGTVRWRASCEIDITSIIKRFASKFDDDAIGNQAMPELKFGCLTFQKDDGVALTIDMVERWYYHLVERPFPAF